MLQHASKTHVKDMIFKWAQFRVQWFISFPEFTEITEFNKSSAPFRKNSIIKIGCQMNPILINPQKVIAHPVRDTDTYQFDDIFASWWDDCLEETWHGNGWLQQPSFSWLFCRSRREGVGVWYVTNFPLSRSSTASVFSLLGDWRISCQQSISVVTVVLPEFLVHCARWSGITTRHKQRIW